MTAVTIRGTFNKDSRPSNGLEEIADQLIRDTAGQHVVVGVVKWAGGNMNEAGQLVPAVKFLGIEPITGPDAVLVQEILDRARQGRGLSKAAEEFAKYVKTPPQEETLFDDDFAGDDEPVRNASGEPVPPPSKAELDAEKAEAKSEKCSCGLTAFAAPEAHDPDCSWERRVKVAKAAKERNASTPLLAEELTKDRAAPAAEFSGKAD